MLKIIRLQYYSSLLLLLPVSSMDISGQGSIVKIKKTDKSWKLEVNGKPST